MSEKFYFVLASISMPEGRPFPYTYLPCIGARLSVTFGNPIAANELLEALRPSASYSNVSQSIPSHESSALITQQMVQVQHW